MARTIKEQDSRNLPKAVLGWYSSAGAHHELAGKLSRVRELLAITLTLRNAAIPLLERSREDRVAFRWVFQQTQNHIRAEEGMQDLQGQLRTFSLLALTLHQPEERFESAQTFEETLDAQNRGE